MSTIEADQATVDCAHEWMSVNYPDAEGEEYERLLDAAIADLQRIEADAESLASFAAWS